MLERLINCRRPPQRAHGPQSQRRVQAKAAVIAEQLKTCSKRELEMLIRYYIQGQQEEQVLATLGGTPEEFTLLRSRFRQLTRGVAGPSAKAKAASAV